MIYYKRAVTLCNLSRNEFILKIGVSWSGMLHCATFLATCLAISVKAGSFNWLLNRNIATQVADGMLHCVIARKYIAALRDFVISRYVTPCKKVIFPVRSTFYILCKLWLTNYCQ